MGTKAGSICSVYNCKNYTWQKNSLSQFRFPRDKEVCGQWVAKCGSLKLEEIFKKGGSLYSNKICSKHFAVTDFRNPNLTSQGLRKGVVPSLHVFPLGSASNPSQTNVPSTEKTSHKKKTALNSSKTKSSMTASSKDNSNDAHSLKPTKPTSVNKQSLPMHPVISAASGASTTKYIAKQKQPAILYRRQKTVKDNKPEVPVPPISLDKTKTSSVMRTKPPENLRCASLHCTSQKNSMRDLKFYHFPTNKIRAKLWATNCGRPDLIDLDPCKLHNDYVLCSLHFERNDFTNNSRSCLNHFAIPTSFNNSNHHISETSSSSSFAYFGLPTSVIKVEPSDPDLTSQIHTSQGLFDENSPEYNADGYQNEHSQEIVYADENLLCSTTTRPSLKHVATQTDLPWKNNTAVVADNSTTGVLCRLCASMVLRSQMVPIFRQCSDSKQYLHIINQLLPSSEQVTENDNMPQWICNDCCGILDYCDLALQGFMAANRKLKHLLWNLTNVRGTKTNKAPVKNTMPSLKLASSVHREYVKKEVTVDICEPIKEEIIDEEQNDEDQNDTTNEQLEHDIGSTSEQGEDHNNDDNAERVDLKITKRKRENANANVQIRYNLKSGSSNKLIRRDGENHVRDSSVIKKLSLLNVKESQETVIQSSHTTILTYKDKKTFLCPICDMLFDSIEAALTHRFKKHSREEFSNQVQVK